MTRVGHARDATFSAASRRADRARSPRGGADRRLLGARAARRAARQSIRASSTRGSPSAPTAASPRTPASASSGRECMTAQMQLIAEELSVPVARVRLVQCDTSMTPDQGTTSGSQSSPTNFNNRNLALAAATAREALLQRASARLGVPVDQLSVADGVVVGARPIASRRVTYGELVGGQTCRCAAQRDREAKAGARVDGARHVRRRASICRRMVTGAVRVRAQRARRRHGARRASSARRTSARRS